MTEESNKPTANDFAKSIQEWWDSDACKNLQKAHKENVERAVGKYFMLSEEDKCDMVQAICTIMCKAEEEGVSHRGLQDALGIYPAGFWISELMDVHNALWSHYHDKNQEKELKDDLDALEKFTQNKKKIKKSFFPE
jgi:hypothetical protein